MVFANPATYVTIPTLYDGAFHSSKIVIFLDNGGWESPAVCEN